MNAGFRGFLIFFVLIAALSIPAVSGFSGNASPCVIQRGPVLTSMTTSSVSITWWTEQPCTGMVTYGETSQEVKGQPDRIVPEEKPSQVHRITLTNLTPDHAYSYLVSGTADRYSFRTFPENGTVRFVVYGDTREQLPWWNQSTHHTLVAGGIAAEPDVLFVVHTGDLVNDPEDTDEWDRFFAAAEPMFSHIPFYPVAGNHEQDSGILREIFGMPPWYVIRAGDVRVVVLDSNHLYPNMTAAQDEFVAGNPGQGGTMTFVALHHPLYSADPNHPGGFLDVRERWEPVFRERGVSAVFAAHVHAYEHAERHGIHYFTVATGGAPSYQLSPDKPEGYVTGLENTLGYAVVMVDPTSDTAVIQYTEVARVEGGEVVLHEKPLIQETVTVQGRELSGPRLSWWPLPDYTRISPVFLLQ
jgi:predicted phosphodiesterase